MTAAADPRTNPSRARRLGRVWLVGLACAAVVALPQVTNAAEGDTPGATTTVSGDNYIPTTTIGDRSIDITALAPQCIADTPYIQYAIAPVGFTSSGPATLSFYDLDGNFIESRTVPSLTGSTIYPGASSNPPDWPGWTQAENGNWIPDPTDAAWRDGLRVVATLDAGADQPAGLQAEGTVSYPPATSPCAGPQLNPSLDLSAFTPVCIADAPFIEYDITPIGFTSTGPATLTFYDKDGNFVEERTVPTLSGRTIYPGASVDANGKPTDWPGWTQAENGNWIPDDSDAYLRDGLTIAVSVDSGADQPQGLVFVQQVVEATATVSYPPATSSCFGPPQGIAPTTTICVGSSGSTSGNQATTTNPCSPCVPSSTTAGSSSATSGEGNCDPCVPGTTVPGGSGTSGTNCSLPRTGSDGVQKILTIGGILLAAGVVAMLFARRRKSGAASV